ncbi:DUF899 family protein [Streptoalloteichus tenebrarius]|uniref:DUF899 family protein n=1 Tax=Streptoalloteichus tenebrarius (strain ATCC 17920 / DSM 40477 / JCM 4838 / CBS 697.72 / NBRC 16177 / NCIMB 11028 / NRRL B-12390 / A12253. 1 / ISP 5477) TaxID=1933 RepID=UPI0020A46364|nr:DUF899 family protein [Streptoalloteichus tenebrarius]
MHASATAEHRAARAELAAAERQLRAAAERVAALRRSLPPGPEVDPATPLTTASGKPVTLGGLFGPHRTLLTYGMRFDEGWDEPCPTCAMWVDGLDGVAPHLAERAGVAVLAPASPGQLAAVAARRAWTWVPVASTQPGDLLDRLGARDEDGRPTAVLSVFHWGEDGRVRLHWQGPAGEVGSASREAGATGEADGEPAGEPAGEPDGEIDLVRSLCAAWGLLDLLPEGPGDWRPTRRDRPAPRR